MRKHSALTFLVDLVAVYRLTKLITEDRITEEMREFIWDRTQQGSKLNYLISCPWCVSIWAGVAIFTLRKISPDTADWLSAVLASSAATGLAITKGY